MTHVRGVLRFEIRKHRLYQTIDVLAKLVACISIATEHRLGRDTKWISGACAGFECAQFDLTIDFPLVGPLEHLLKNKTVLAYEIGVADGRKAVPKRGDPSFKGLHSTVILALFVQFYEANSDWLNSKFTNDFTKWPAVWQFGRRVRDAASHGNKLSIQNQKFVPVKWHTLSYGPAQHGRSIFDQDLAFGDIFVLMNEMSDSLDAHNAPR